MDGNQTIRRSATLILAGLALAWPSTAAVSQDGATVSEPVVQQVAPDFADRFPTVPEPDVVADADPGAVDVTEIDPPVEIVEDEPVIATGVASYYGRRFHGRRTASGEAFDMTAMTAAHRSLPFGTQVRVINPRNGRSVVVRINDRGPFSGNRLIDLSRAAAEEIGIVRAGHGRVELALVD